MTQVNQGLESAIEYGRRGLCVVPIPNGTKAPVLDEWQNLRLTTPEQIEPYFNGTTMNVGVLNGEPSGWQVDVDLDHPDAVTMADDYLPDVHSRLILYKRIASAADSEELRELQVEMIDRFGLLPEPVKQLFAVTELKLAAVPLGIVRIDAGDSAGRLVFGSRPNVDPTAIIRLVQGQADHYRLDGTDKIRFQFEMHDAGERVQRVSVLLASLSPRAD